jgi:putative transposase
MSNPIVVTSIGCSCWRFGPSPVYRWLRGSGAVFPINGRLRDECLNEHLFTNLNEARQIIEEWRIDYNTNRPHTSLDGLTPTEFATRPNRGQTQNGLSL